ncbi:MAG: COX15/CtaA family protein [Candidatus Thiodiazotropha sp. (ex Ctena orbiculata)]|uniref:COX15/CtaA family protein n=1 Tax=Candidatus Thiodiazotropha taylori TaxID=2792791 RepID=A0A944QT49_9GAMM|nr:COX15/CtaA family protein [Candidatus Thiodiazotropha taylori]MBT3027195.1 COX15/CtaA family protein [Candidatus Thiodiazotropha taylori]MBT3034829.1 COX15/CtaA family protein [Candidatus Thiodiazotropha taylori]MBV2137257.1 COX15/CtaA family protein [Candidatus Thiodiazotropha taylori]
MRNHAQSPFPHQYRLAMITCLLAFCVILVGAYVRLSDAGLGCPDWPGCYGQMVVPTDASAVAAAEQSYADRPLDRGKAWKEMVHRYLAGSLGLAILLLAILAWRGRSHFNQPLMLPMLLLLLVLFQAALGMWTVTLLVKPFIVTAHLLGGFATFVLLGLLVLKLRPVGTFHALDTSNSQRWWIRVSLVILLLQISLGGWTSTNYAALACTEFPTCYAGSWWPEMDFSEAFVLWRGLGVNYEFGVLENSARTAIHMTHRIGAMITALTLGLLAWYLTRPNSSPLLRRLGITLLLLLALQITLGISNVLGHLPLSIAVAHNGGAALLLLLLVTLIWISRSRE